jgi:hypothetical protein
MSLLLDDEPDTSQELDDVYTGEPTYRPRNTKWDDDIHPEILTNVELNEDAVVTPAAIAHQHRISLQVAKERMNIQASNDKRLCFDCMVNPCVLGTIRCEPCTYKRNRRLAVKV